MGDEDEIMQAFYFCSHAERILSSHQINAAIDSCFMKILNSIENFIRNGSGWQINHVTYIDLHIDKYREIRGGCKNIELPKKLKLKKAIIQINSNDYYCFLYAIAAYFFPVKFHAERVSNYKKYIKHFKTGNLKFPLSVYDIEYFEILNKLKINVF